MAKGRSEKEIELAAAIAREKAIRNLRKSDERKAAAKEKKDKNK